MDLRIAALAAAALAPALAHADTAVPAITDAPNPYAVATASASASAGASAAPAATPAGEAALPPGLPPAVHLLSPSAPLNAKERHATALARRWARAHYMPHAGADGVIRFPFGATMPTVVCAPLQACDLQLQAGEVVNGINLGDKVRWSILPAGLSGSPEGAVTHLTIKPVDAGLVSSMTIQTNRRTYSVKLVSTQAQWMPLTGFTYADDQDRAWAGYQRAVGVPAAFGGFGQGAAGNLVFYSIHCEGSPDWKPTRAWTDGLKTYVEFPGPLGAGSPALVGLANDGGWFSKPTAQVVNYRPIGNRFVADASLQRAALILGVGSAQQECILTREARR